MVPSGGGGIGGIVGAVGAAGVAGVDPAKADRAAIPVTRSAKAVRDIELIGISPHDHYSAIAPLRSMHLTVSHG